jgi:PAS domain S-box-containing protein
MRLTLGAKKLLIVVLTAAVVLVLFAVGYFSIDKLREIEALWATHSREATLHLEEVNHIRSHFGYGGFTHHFRTYLLRQTPQEERKTEERLQQLLQALRNAEKLNLTPLERLAIADIHATTEDYQQQFALARRLVAAGHSASMIDRQVRVYDAPAIRAFALLNELSLRREEKAERQASQHLEEAINAVTWGVLLFPLILLVAFLLLRFLQQLVDANRALERVSRELDTILDNAPDAMLSVLQDGRIVRVNTRAEQLFGYSREEFSRLNIEQLVPQPQRSHHSRMRLLFMQVDGQEHRAGQGRVLQALTKDGQVVPVEIGLSVIHRDNYVRAIATVRDVTERQQAQQHIEQLNSSLLAQNQELEAVNGELEAFSYSVSHDLRTPLRSIEGFSQLVLRKYRERLDETGRDYLERIRKATVRMGQLIDDLLTLSRLTRTEMAWQPIDLSAMSYEILQTLCEQEPERTVKWTVEEGVMASGDAALLRAALENLLGNAWKYTATGEQAVIHFGVERHEREQVFFVKDNGVGFDMQYADKLFGAFQRLHGVEEFEGTGIGLSSVQRIIHRHGGRIWAEAAAGKGACFYFTLGSGEAVAAG